MSTKVVSRTAPIQSFGQVRKSEAQFSRIECQHGALAIGPPIIMQSSSSELAFAPLPRIMGFGERLDSS